MRALTRWLSLVAFCALMAAPTVAEAQGRRGERPNREQLEQRMRAQMGRMMQERLGLDEEQSASLAEVVQDFDTQRRELARREQAARRRAEALADSTGGDEEVRAVLRLQTELRMEEAELFRAEQEALLEVLSPRQVLELQELRQDLGRRIRSLRGGGRGNSSNDFRGPQPRRDGRIGSVPRSPRGPPLS